MAPSTSLAPTSPWLRIESSTGVSVGPGQTTLTVMPYRPTSRAKDFESEITPPTPALATAAPDCPALAPSDPKVMIRPTLRSIMPGKTACAK